MRTFYNKTNANQHVARPIAQPLPPEEKFSYFCKFDQLRCSMICPDVPLPALKQSCYQKITDIFDEE